MTKNFILHILSAFLVINSVLSKFQLKLLLQKDGVFRNLNESSSSDDGL